MQKVDFKGFYNQHFDRVYRFIFFRVSSKEVAEDLTSEVFISALKHFHKYDSTKSTTAWIMTITRNRLKNHWRDRRVETDVDEVAFMLKGEDGRETLERTGDEIILRKALDELQPKDRQLVEMKYLIGYGYKDMAEILEKSVGALKVETHRAMKKLKEICST